MAHQLAVTIVAEVRDEAADEARRVLATMGDGVADPRELDFSALGGLHFARFVLVEAVDAGDGSRLPASILYMSDVDVSLEQHLGELADRLGPGIDRLLGACVGYPAAPDREARAAFLRAHVVRAPAHYVNTIGRTAARIRDEARLRDRVEAFLDRRSGEADAGEVQRAVRGLVDGEADLAWARVPAEGVDRPFRRRERAHAILMPLLLVVLLPVILPVAAVFVVVLRIKERRDPAPHVKAPPQRVQELAGLEDHLVHNPFTAVGLVKPGVFRKVALWAILQGIDYSTRHVFNKGSLAGVKTIHFARWVYLDGGRRVLFASNYDGSLESYMDDFIDKIAWGLNVVFTNGVGYPRTKFFLWEGARDELAFKDYLRVNQVPTRVWYSAYGRLTTANIASNARLRAGLQHDATDPTLWTGVP